MESPEVLKTLKSIDKKLDNLNHPPLWRYFLQGLLTGLGTIIGATVLLAISIAILRNFITVPVVGEWISDIIEVVQNRGN